MSLHFANFQSNIVWSWEELAAPDEALPRLTALLDEGAPQCLAVLLKSDIWPSLSPSAISR